MSRRRGRRFGLPEMSLRQRFVIIVSLAVVALVTAALGLVELRAESQAARESTAVEQCDAAVDALVRRAKTSSIVSDPSSPESRTALRASASSVAAPLVGIATGYCLTDGSVLAYDAEPFAEDPPSDGAVPHSRQGEPPPPGGGPPHDRRRPPPAPVESPPGMPPRDLGPSMPNDREDGRPVPNFSRQLGDHLPPPDLDMIFEACHAPDGDRVDHQRVRYGRDLILLSVKAVQPSGLAAWSIVRIPPSPGDGGIGWPIKIGIMALATFLLVALTVDALLVLRRGADDLTVGLAKLRDDLRAEIPEPRADELSRIATGLRTMASHLADAQERERALSQALGHEQRLAGLGRVVAGVAHEVRNPLAGIKLKLDQMARRRIDDRSMADIGICLQEIGRLDRVVSSLLWVARKGAIEKEAVDLGVLCRQRVLAAEGAAEARKIKVVAMGEATAPANREELTRVLDNLIRNAIEAGPEGSEVRVHVEIAQAAAEVKIRVEDGGPGIPDSRREELFEPFFTLKPEGTGLGLFLSRSLVEAHEGRLTYDRVGETTRFTVSLPRDSVDADDAEDSDR